MKKCPNCGADNVDESLSCSRCFTSFAQQNQQFNNPNNMMNGFNTGNIPQNARPLKPKKGKKILGFSIAGILGVVAIVIALNVFGIFMAPEERVIASLRSSLSFNNMQGAFKISVKGTPSDDFPEQLNKISLNGYVCNNDNKPYTQFAVAVNNKNIIECSVEQQEKDLFFAIGKNAICLNIDQIMKVTQGSKSSSLVTEYFSQIDWGKLFTKKYDKAIADVLKDKIVKENGKYIVTINANDVFNVLSKIVDIAVEDDELYKQLYDILKNISQNAKKDKLDLGSNFEEIINMPKETVISQMKVLGHTLKKGMSSVKDELSKLPSDLKCVLTMDIGAGNKIKTMDISLGTADLKVLINIDNTKTIVKKQFDKNTSVVIGDIIKDKEKLNNYAVNVATDLISNEDIISGIDELGFLDDIKDSSGMDTKTIIMMLKENMLEEIKNKLHFGSNF